MSVNKLKIKDYLYLSAFHLCEKVSKKDIKIRTFNVLNGISFVFCLSIIVFVIGQIQKFYGITLNVGKNTSTVVGLITILAIIHYSLKSYYKVIIGFSETQIKQMKSTIRKGVLIWTIPIVSIFSIILFSLLIAFGGNNK